jgi:DNA topoisomerase-1
MPTNLVIVESPAKAKTIKKFLGKEFAVEASMGHVRDLPEKKLGVDVEKDFEPTYVIPEEKETAVKHLQTALKGTKKLWIATDEDREGEAIGWHLLHALKIPAKEQAAVKRIVFHEITEEAIKAAVAHPRKINLKLVHAQQARRILDRLVGYTLSPFLWAKVYRGLSAGRVQSVAVRLIVDREREVQAFKAEEYWSVTAELETEKGESFTAELREKGGKKYVPVNTEQANAVVEEVKNAPFKVAELEEKKLKRNPSPPYTTSTLQQDAANKLGFSVKQTMVIAQQLYEGVNLGKGIGTTGLITYMRTDSVNLSKKVLEDAKLTIEKLYGREYVLTTPRTFRTKSKNAQEAHEAIRPTEVARTPESLKDVLDHQQLRLYTLIWNRTMATQMPPAELKRVSADIVAAKYTFRATGQTVEFDGFLRVLKVEPSSTHTAGKSEEDPEDVKEHEEAHGEKFLPQLRKEEIVKATGITPEQHFTKPPPRYTEATLVKKLEEEGIGRPSTYAPTISTIQQRGYIRKEGRQLIPESVAFTVTDLMTEHFPDIVDLKFTAKVEESLDNIAAGKMEWVPFMHSFFTPFHALVERKSTEVKKEDVLKETTTETCPECSAPMLVKLSRYGKFLACSQYPKCKGKRPMPEDREKQAAFEAERKELEAKFAQGLCPECKSPLTVKHGRYGMFVGCTGYPKCHYIKKIEVSSGVKCEVCGKGELVEKRTRRGKRFWGCNQYPRCKNASWTDPRNQETEESKETKETKEK